MRTRIEGVAGMTARGALLLALLLAWSWNGALAADTAELEKSLKPGVDAFARVAPQLDALSGPMSRDVLDGKADLHVFYGMVMARLLYEQCQDTLSLMRSAQIQECPALNAALEKRLGDSAARLEGAAQLIAGSLPMTASPRVGIVGKAAVEALRMYLIPLMEFTGSRERREL
ncbi:hypothetical protein [Fundidesulfovibrio terrae]|uniref:hypothetical protein n=1 Tax=Fundidesulfovibrio terrae TaxID=2922866 RepID=UPI001FAEC3C9|nr:hypothetical protein [Fundidesulfovibrio terrae]